MPIVSRILLACLLFPGAFVATSRAAETTDAEIARNMGPPFYSRAILPTPREVEYGSDNTVLVDGLARIDHCDVSFPEDAAVRELVERLWKQRLDRYREQFEGTGWAAAEILKPIAFRMASQEAEDLPGLDPALARRIPVLPPQGYVLQIDKGGAIGIGKDRAGVVNAFASLLQLVHVDGSRLVVQQARIIDWPTFTIRYTSEYRLLGPDYFDWLMLYKINGFAASYRVFDWRGPTDEQREQLKAIGEYIERYGTLHFLAELHLSGRAQGEVVMDSRNPEHRDQLFQTIRTLLEVGKARHIWICYDDSRPELQPMEIDAGFESPAAAHAALFEEIHAFATDIRPEVTVGWVPVPYQGRVHRRWRRNSKYRDYDIAYLEAIRNWSFTEAPIVWTGPVTESRSITLEDIEDYYGRIGPGKRLSYWDNTWHYHQPLRNFHAKYPDRFVEHCAEAASYINVNCATPIGRFFTATANDYYWNPNAFDSKRCRRHAVAQFMGPEAIEPAERFYELRGEDYWVFFAAKVDLEAFAQVLEDLESASWDPAIPKTTWSSLDSAAKAQDKPSPRQNK
ncbi:MAG: glycoside hydrolase family 20 zincin-like fold domain-containing protein [Candidatus Hydrogenedentes bacterium]|nr:glycoside hydrolase family 20 zincin-like fold domain-containing protein [Candidatus Hydrogenedentota bacterium]